MSPRAACQLELLGFTDVYDYLPGKADWTAAGLPREGESSHIPYAGDLADREVPRCHFRRSLGEVRQILVEHGFCAVTTDDNVVLGTVHADDIRSRSSDTTVEQAMRRGPSTVRANAPVEPLVERMRRADMDAILVTTPEGRVIGLLNRHDAEQSLTRNERR